MRSLKILIAFIGIFIFFQAVKAHGFEKATHFTLNGYAIEKSELNSNLKNIGLSGVTEIINGFSAKYLIQNGGFFEDEPAYTRSRNHFHNPLLIWDQAGLNSGIFTGKSAVLWSFDQSGRRSTDLGGDWSWLTARKFYLAALTGDSTLLSGFEVDESFWSFSTIIAGKANMNEAERNQFFGWMFRALGQQMHLLQDMSVPSHTRNDVHIKYNYEKKVESMRATEPATFQGLLSKPIYFNGGASRASFFDTNRYTLSSGPDITGNLTSDAQGNFYSNIGLSEYTNANFFSEDTIFSSFASPAKARTNALLVEIQAEDGAIDRVYRIFPIGQNYSLATYSYFYQPLTVYSAYEGWKYNLDDDVYRDYASMLLPRAVGYSAGLLNYFFRGKIDMTAAPNASGQYVIENKSEEPMEGTFNLYYDDKDGFRNHVATWTGMQIPANGTSSPVTFTEPSYPEPKEKGKYILVFQGKLGNEGGAVAGRIVEPEPQKEELILYLKLGEGYKTYNTKTKEVKPYKGIFEGMTGDVIWREDGRAFIGKYGGSWMVVDLNKGIKRFIMNGGIYIANGGWRGETAVMLGIDKSKIIYWEGTADSGKTTNYDAPAGIGYLSESVIGWGTIATPPRIATSLDGTVITYAGYNTQNSGNIKEYYLVNFDTVNKTFSSVKVGDTLETHSEWISLCSNGYVEPFTSVQTNYPLLLTEEANAARVLYRNNEVNLGVVTAGWDPKDKCYIPVSRYQNYTINYDAIGGVTSEYQCSYAFDDISKSYKKSCSSHSLDLYPLNEKLTDGMQIIPFVRREQNIDNSQKAIVSVTPCVSYGGSQICSGYMEMERQAAGYIRTYASTLMNIGQKRDKVVGVLASQLLGYYPNESKQLRTVFYVSDGKFHDITNENADFQNANFLMFLE